jgi:hypothetical protein
VPRVSLSVLLSRCADLCRSVPDLQVAAMNGRAIHHPNRSGRITTWIQDVMDPRILAVCTAVYRGTPAVKQRIYTALRAKQQLRDSSIAPQGAGGNSSDKLQISPPVRGHWP